MTYQQFTEICFACGGQAARWTSVCAMCRRHLCENCNRRVGYANRYHYRIFPWSHESVKLAYYDSNVLWTCWRCVGYDL